MLEKLAQGDSVVWEAFVVRWTPEIRSRLMQHGLTGEALENAISDMLLLFVRSFRESEQ